MAPKALTRSEVADLARSLQALLDVIERDEMSASTATAYRLEGAVTVSQTVLGAMTTSSFEAEAHESH